MPEGKEEDQEIENLFEQIMKENFPNPAKEIDFQEVQEAQRVPKKLDPRRNTPILEAAREKDTVTYKGVPIRYQLISQKKLHRQEGAGKKYLKS